MLKGITKLLGGDPIRQELDRHQEIVHQINAFEPQMRELDEARLQGKTAEFRNRLAAGEALDEILPEAFAVVREVSIRTIGLRHFDVQLIGGVALHEGRIAEMKTGEGKTLVATMPIYLNALTGEGVHLVTVNDYLARRDARWMGPIFHQLGLSVGVLQEAARTEHGRKAFLYDIEREASQEDVHQLKLVDRKLAYEADVTYGTNNEFGFDYLRDNMAQTLEARSQRGHHYAILDEVDNILIDEARTPLIISGPSHEDPDLYQQMARVVKQLSPEDFEISERDRTVSLTEIGEDHAEQLIGQPLRDLDRPEDITQEQARLLGFLEQSLRAQFLFKRNKDYVVQGGRVIIVDEFTGRMMAGRRWSDGLHQAVEAKEGVKVRQENVTYATITLQNYFRMYEKLSGMTGTALTEAEEFNKIYSVDVLPLPTNLEYVAMQPDSELLEVEYRENGHKFISYSRSDDPEAQPVFWQRKDYQDEVFRTEEAKLRAVTMEILSRHVLGQPLLVGTTSVELSEKLSSRLRAQLLQRLSMIQVLRAAYMEAHDIPDDGMRIEELQQLYGPLDTLSSALMRPFSNELELPMNPTKPDNLARLAQMLGLDPRHHERLTNALQGGIPHNVLNAKRHAEESAIIASAGAFGAVTIATNMAGRGVDIKLGGEIAEEVLAAINRVLRRAGIDDPAALNLEERLEALSQADTKVIGIYDAEVALFRKFMEEEKLVRQVGGLHVIGSERHEARRIDNQLRGRSSRQGDPGSSQFFLSLEDELMRLFGGAQVSGLMQRLNIDDATPIAHGLVNRTIEQSQTRVEGANFDRRKHLLEYDDVLNQQREVFYTQRNRVFVKDDLSEDIDEMLRSEAEAHVLTALDDPEGPWRLLAWLEGIQPTLGLETERPYPSFMLATLLEVLDGTENAAELKPALERLAVESLEAQTIHARKAAEDQLERTLSTLDEQVRQRVDLAEMAVEGTLIEAEEFGNQPDPQALLTAVETAAGMRMQVDGQVREQIREDPEGFRKAIPGLIEASLGLRVWTGLVQAIERRIGERLDLQVESPIDWDAAETSLFEAMNESDQRRIERVSKDISRELGQSLRGTSVEADKIRALVQLSYSRQKVFDAKSHQAREMVLPRISYAYHAATLLEGQSAEELTDRVLRHLEGAKQAIHYALGESELHKRGVMGLDERLQAELRTSLGSEAYEEAAAAESLAPDVRQQIAKTLGRSILMEAHRRLLLNVGDRLWVDYLTEMEALRTSIGLEAYGQRDPLVQYKSRAVDMFQNLLASIRSGVVSRAFRLQAGPPQRVVRPAPRSAVSAQDGGRRPKSKTPSKVNAARRPSRPETRGSRPETGGERPAHSGSPEPHPSDKEPRKRRRRRRKRKR